MKFIDSLPSPAREIALAVSENPVQKEDATIVFDLANTTLMLAYELLKMSPGERVANGWKTSEIKNLYAELNLDTLELNESELLGGIETLRVALREHGAPHEWLKDKTQNHV